MSLPPLRLISDSHFCLSGDVLVDASAAIAPGVILQADPGCRLIIAPGVSIGAGSMLHAYQGTLEVGAGATLGSGVLIVGACTIGMNACIGSRTTIYNSAIAAEQFVAPASLIGDMGRQIEAANPPQPYGTPPPQTPSSSLPHQPYVAPPPQTAAVSPTVQPPYQPYGTPSPPYGTPSPLPHQPYVAPSSPAVPSVVSAPAQPNPAPLPTPTPTPTPATTAPSRQITASVYGQAYVNRIMLTLFPHRQALEAAPPESAPNAGASDGPPP